MATILAGRQAPAPAATSSQLDRHRLLQPSRAYSVTRNPFAVWEVLPVVSMAFAGLAIAMLFINDLPTATIAVGGFLVVTLGALLIAAVSLKGTLDLTHEGIAFQRGKEHLTASWDQVVGVEHRRECGLTLLIRDPQLSGERIRMPGGLGADSRTAQIPLRLFGDRQFSILYDIRDRLPEAEWRPALEAASKRSPARILAVYGGVVAISGLAIWAVLNILS